ncbi:MAG: radical SAM protein [Kiritimatiellae bacterium]|nr:radical SAM protein [Kiritimatiellia bacterium]
MPANHPLFRPPAEAGSLILQVDEGCPHNRCTFCGMYKGVRYVRRALDVVAVLIDAECRLAPGTRRVFLADGDVMSRSYEELAQILTHLHRRLPALSRVNVYANGSSILAKPDAELRALRERGLHTLYMGLESGDEAILDQTQKGETAEQMVEAAVRAQAAGLHMSVMVLLGLGGRHRTCEHALNSARALNRMQPRLLSFLRVIPIAGTRFHSDIEAGTMAQLSEFEVVEELRAIVAGLDLARTVFRANHSSNIVPLEARLPRDKQNLLDALDALLESGTLDESGPGPVPMWL